MKACLLHTYTMTSCTLKFVNIGSYSVFLWGQAWESSYLGSTGLRPPDLGPSTLGGPTVLELPYSRGLFLGLGTPHSGINDQDTILSSSLWLQNLQCYTIWTFYRLLFYMNVQKHQCYHNSLFIWQAVTDTLTVLSTVILRFMLHVSFHYSRLLY